ncbi:hypothetical protein BH24CHL1_BH24CHL1_19070 [soil metagenome]
MKQRCKPKRRSAYTRWGLFGTTAAAAVMACLALFLDIPLYPALVISVSLVLFVLYGYDKRCAIAGGGRVPEVVLHGMALAGGFAGGWAGRLAFRHKTRNAGFLAVLLISTIVHALIIVWLWR